MISGISMLNLPPPSLSAYATAPSDRFVAHETEEVVLLANGQWPSKPGILTILDVAIRIGSRDP